MTLIYPNSKPKTRLSLEQENAQLQALTKQQSENIRILLQQVEQLREQVANMFNDYQALVQQREHCLEHHDPDRAIEELAK